MISVRVSDQVPLVFVARPNVPCSASRASRPGRSRPASLSVLQIHFVKCSPLELERDGQMSGRTVRGNFTTNDIDVMRDAALTGLGVACPPLPHVALQLATGSLLEVLIGWAPTLAPNHLYYPSRRQPTAVLRALVAAMRV